MVKLIDWQKTLKPRSSIIFQASEYDRLCDGWVPFTIGMSYKYAHVPCNELTQIGDHERLVLCAVREETDGARRPQPPNRKSIIHTLHAHGICNEFKDSSDFFYRLPHYKFVISPEGNGIDCHRHYEALMAGCIPIIEDHPGIRDKYAGCPVLWTQDYSEITPEYLTAKYHEMLHADYDFSRLFIESYSPEIQNQIRDNGNYWGQRLSGIKWY